MKRKRFSEEQIIGILKEAEAGAKSTDLCRRRASASKPSTAGKPSTQASR
jgi:putative transposase